MRSSGSSRGFTARLFTSTSSSNARPVNQNAKVPDDVAAVVPLANKMRFLDWAYFAEQRSAMLER